MTSPAARNPPPHPLRSPPSPPPSTSKPKHTPDIEANIPLKPRHALIPGFRNPPPFLVFLRHNWYDITTQLLCCGLAFLLYTYCPPIMPRYFPYYPGIEKSAWGMAHSKPILPEYISTLVSAIVSFAVPAMVMGAIALWGTRRFEDGTAALMGLGYALATATLFQSLIKIFVGGLRPHFLTVCRPHMSGSPFGLMTLPQSDIRYYTAKQLCTGSKSDLKEAQMSFPSGHACAAFAGFGFLALWLNAKYKVLSRGGRFRDHYGTSEQREGIGEQQRMGKRVHHWKLVSFVAPWCIAMLFALSKLRDSWHHPIDIIFGSLVGIFFAHMAYKMVYCSVYDWRTNHVPLGYSEDEMEKVDGKKA